MFIDVGIDEELKDIGELLGIPVRSYLLHEDIASTDVAELLQDRTQSDVLSEICSRLRQESQNDEPVAGFREGNLRLFGWLLNHGKLDSLDTFPALTREECDEESAPRTHALSKDADEEVIPLAPPECWPEAAREFADLFPQRHVLCSDYCSHVSDNECWALVSKRGFLRLGPVYQTKDFVQDFVPDDSLADDVIHKSEEPVQTTQIAFLRMKNVGLMDSARKSKSKCLSLIRFLAAYMVQSDPSWKEHPAAKCECDKTHKHWLAGWIVPLKKNKWIYLDKNRSDHLSVDSLARILKDEPEIVALLSQPDGAAFLSELSVSAGDFLMRVVTSDEASRVSLSQSVIQIFQAAGRDIKQVNDLAVEIVTRPETLKEIQERAETRKKVKRNQNVGRAVELAFQSALGTGYGLKVERAPFGSDYSVEPENDFLDESGNEVLLSISGKSMKFLIEIKATIGNHIRMTDVQGKTAKEQSGNYALCVVLLDDQDTGIDEALVRTSAKFVFDIGTRIRPLVDALESLEGSRSKALTSTGEIELEMQDQSVKFRVGHEVWDAGVGFDEAIHLLGGHTSDVGPTEADIPEIVESETSNGGTASLSDNVNIEERIEGEGE